MAKIKQKLPHNFSHTQDVLDIAVMPLGIFEDILLLSQASSFPLLKTHLLSC